MNRVINDWNSLPPNYDVESNSNKATRLLNLLHRNLFSCSSVAKNWSFRSLVIPILEYASQVWNPCTQETL